MNKKFFFIVLSFLFGLFLFDFVSFLVFPISFPSQPSAQGFYYFYQTQTSTEQFVDDLVTNGIISRPFYFSLITNFVAHSRGLKAGEYVFPQGTTPFSLLRKMARGDVLKRKFTLVEGWTFQETMRALDKAPMLKHQLANLTNQNILQQLHIQTTSPEGMFFPATYEYTYGMSDAMILRRAEKVMKNRLNLLWQARAVGLSYRSPYQALIVASLIEKETALPAEKPLIAGIILKRLMLHMPLQIDSTVIYGLGQLYEGHLHSYDLKIDTPYNTYLHYGLPPSPICMPSETSLRAALNPAITNALYYVATGTGGHYFSATYQEHQSAIKRLIAVEQKNNAKTIILEKIKE